MLNEETIVGLAPVDLKVREQGRCWLLPPYNYSVRRIAKELGVGTGTVCKWRHELKEEGLLQDGDENDKKYYSAEQIFSFVIEAATLSEHELSAYCREKWLCVDQLKQWKSASLQVHQPQQESKHRQDIQRRADKKRIKELEKELSRKEKALAETAALHFCFIRPFFFNFCR